MNGFPFRLPQGTAVGRAEKHRLRIVPFFISVKTCPVSSRSAPSPAAANNRDAVIHFLVLGPHPNNQPKIALVRSEPAAIFVCFLPPSPSNKA